MNKSKESEILPYSKVSDSLIILLSIRPLAPRQFTIHKSSALTFPSFRLATVSRSPAIHQSPLSLVPANHLARQSPSHGPPGYIGSRDGTDLCPSSAANPSRHSSKAHRLARWFAGRSQTYHGPATHGRQSPVRALSHTFLQFIWHGNRHSTGLQGISARAMVCRKNPDLPRTAVSARSHTFLQFTWHAIAILGAYRAHPLARWHRFVPIERREPLQTSLQGISARAMVCRKVSELPHTAARARPGLFVKFTWNPDRHSTQVQGILLVQVTSNCAHLHLFRELTT